MAKELSGRDYSDYLTYNSEDEAYSIISSHGGFENLMDSVFGDPCEPSQGSPCLVDIPISGKMMGIKCGDGVACVTRKGMTLISDRYIIRGWSLCHQ